MENIMKEYIDVFNDCITISGLIIQIKIMKIQLLGGVYEDFYRSLVQRVWK